MSTRGSRFTCRSGWPLVGFMVGSVTGDPTAWHADKQVVRLCAQLTWLLALSMALAALGIDLMLPAFDEIREGLGMAPGSTEVTALVTTYFLGLAIGQLAYGGIIPLLFDLLGVGADQVAVVLGAATGGDRRGAAPAFPSRRPCTPRRRRSSAPRTAPAARRRGRSG